MSVFENITRKVSGTAKAAAKKSGSVVEVTRLNITIGSEEERIRKTYSEIGRQLYEEYSGGKVVEGALLEGCEKIDAIGRNIEELKLKILELRNIKACPVCGTELEMDMLFCHKCGKQQEMPEEEPGTDNDEGRNG